MIPQLFPLSFNLIYKLLPAVFLVTALFSPKTASAQFADGDGSESDPYVIETAEQLNEVRNFLDDAFILNEDIDLTDGGFADGDGWEPIGDCDWNGDECDGTPFTGIFNGNGHEIQNLTIDRPGENDIGLFGANDGAIVNLKIIDAQITGNDFVGTIAGVNIDFIGLSAVENTDIGGGDNAFAFDDEPTGVGGIAGFNLDDAIINLSYATGSVETIQGVIGGAVGFNAGQIVNSYTTASTEITDSTLFQSVTGGLAGIHNGVIATSYAAGSVGPSGSQGGLTGGGTGTAADSYFDTDATGVPGSPAGQGLDGSEMRDQNSFSGFDFSDDWQIEDGLEISYPYLQDNPQDPPPGLQSVFAGGEGTEGDPYQIENADQLDAIRLLTGSDNDDVYFIQTDDIDLEEILFDDRGDLIGDGWEPVGTSAEPFAANYDGNGFQILGLTTELPGDDDVGFFGVLTGSVTAMAILDADVEGDARTGIIAGTNEGDISESWADGSVTGNSSEAGGIAGLNDGGTIENSYSVAEVAGESTNSGGLAGSNTGGGTIATSYASGQVDGDDGSIGGLIGFNDATVNNSYWNTEESTQSSSAGGSGLSMEQMLQESSFDGFDFSGVWQIEEDSSYPYLQNNTQDPPPGFSPFADDEGDGSEADPYQISTPFQLAAVRSFTGSDHSDTWFEITEDIDLEDFLDDNGSLINDGAGWIPIGTESDPFMGNLDGNGFVISNLTIYRPNEDEIGFFGHTDGTINRVALEDVDITGNFSFGGFVGVNNDDGTITESYITGSVMGTSSPSTEVGGFAGTNHGTMTDNYALVDVEGEGNGVGGFMAVNQISGSVSNSWASGEVTGDGANVEGFAPFTFGTESNVFFDSDVSGVSGTGAISGIQMRQESNFSTFDFDETWMIDRNGELSYPYLQNNTQDPVPGLIVNPFSSGDGSQDHPFEVSTADELNKIRDYKSAEFIQTADIDLEAGGYSSGEGWMPVGDLDDAFSGVYDGDGFVIQNLTINRPEHSVAGFIGRNTGTLQGITITGASVVASDTTAILAGYNDNGNISEVSVEGFVSGGAKTGGAVGQNDDATLEMLSSEGTVQADGNQTGGLIGQNQRGTINFSWSTSDVDGGGSIAGGLVGDNFGGSGAANEAHINDSYATGDVTSDGSNAGGLAGRVTSNAFVNNTYAAGSASDGGLVANNSVSDPYDNVSDSYWNTSTGQDESEGGSGLSESDMRIQGSFDGFDFDSDWDIVTGEESSYPFLQAFPQDPAPGVLVIPFADGDGSESSPYEVEDAAMLDAVRDFRADDAYFIQTADIDLDSPEFTTGEGWIPIGDGSTDPFTGEYDGDGFEITGLTVNEATEGSLFGFSEADILNLNVSGASVEAGTASILVSNNVGTIDNVHVSGTVTQTSPASSSRAGGIATINAGLIQESSADVTISAGNTYSGGIAAINQTDLGIIENTNATGAVSNSSFNTGGLVGENRHEISDSWADVSIDASGFSGGLAGSNTGSIERSYATGSVSGGSQSGGFVGSNYEDGEISESWSSGTVESDFSNIGGFAGENTDDAQLTDVYSTGSVTGNPSTAGGLTAFNDEDAQINRAWAAGHITPDAENAGGLVNENEGTVNNGYWDITHTGLETSDAGTGKTTIEMMDETTFSGFDFSSVWDIEDYETYPYLQNNTQDPLPSGPASVTIEGDAGWRMLSLPVDDVAVSVLAGQNLVQGVPGANDFYDGEGEPGEYEDGIAANLLYFDPAEFDSTSESATGWIVPENFDYEFESGQGFIWFFYDNDVGPSIPLDDFTLSVSGTPRNSDVTVSMSTDDEWVLVGNPFTSNLHASELDSTGLQSGAAQIYDPAGDTYEIVNFSGDETIAQWQGFFIENESADEFEIPADARTSDDADFFRGEPEQELKQIEFVLEGVNEEHGLNTTDRAIALVLDENAQTGWDPLDVRKLIPMTSVFATLAFVGERNDETILKAQESRPLEMSGSVEIEMELNLNNMGGEFTLGWDGLEEIDEEIDIFVYDPQTGTEVNLREEPEYVFMAGFAEAETADNDDTGGRASALTTSEIVDEDYSLVLILDQDFTDTDPGPELPEEVALHQNYPNPFNPVTNITYDLPEAENVRLDVYNVVGQRVATLVNTHQSAGTHTVSFDASALASGVYLYRLQAGDVEFTKKMMFVK